MAMITPNFNFAGRCEEALSLYQKAFGAEALSLLRYEDARKEDFNQALTPEEAKYIYHAELMVGGQRIMMCDNMDVPFQTSYALSLTVTFDTKEEVQRAFDVLKEDAKIIYPMQRTTYSSCMVVFIDRFGFRWGLMTEQTER